MDNMVLQATTMVLQAITRQKIMDNTVKQAIMEMVLQIMDNMVIMVIMVVAIMEEFVENVDSELDNTRHN